MCVYSFSDLTPGIGEVFLGYSQQVCFGMEYLSSKGFIHGNLQAQNVLLTANQVLKVVQAKSYTLID